MLLDLLLRCWYTDIWLMVNYQGDHCQVWNIIWECNCCYYRSLSDRTESLLHLLSFCGKHCFRIIFVVSIKQELPWGTHSYLWALTLVSVPFRSRQNQCQFNIPPRCCLCFWCCYCTVLIGQYTLTRSILTSQIHWNMEMQTRRLQCILGSINNFGKDRTAFDLNYKRTPIYQKTFI